jgi:hypothetical protein
LYADPDPDPTAQINADPCGSGSGYGSGSETLILPLTFPQIWTLQCSKISLTLMRIRIGIAIYEKKIYNSPDFNPVSSELSQRRSKRQKMLENNGT